MSLNHNKTRGSKINRQIKLTLILSGVFLLMGVTLLVLAKTKPGFAEGYARNIFPILPNAMGKITAKVPFVLFEAILLLLAVLVVLMIIISVIKVLGAIIKRVKGEKVFNWRSVLLNVTRLLLAGSLLFWAFTLNCGINYQRDSIIDQLAIEKGQTNLGELRQLFRLLLTEMEELENFGEMDKEKQKLWPEIVDGSLAVSAMENIQDLTPGLLKSYPRPKASNFSQVLSKLQLSGYFSSYTMEAVYNADMPRVNQPFTICHELAHISGFAKEEDANFLAYLACSLSPDDAYRYSGLLQALSYVLNDLYSNLPPEEYEDFYQLLPQEVKVDFATARAYWRAFDGKTADVYWQANDAFLKANDQEAGMDSYGIMVDLLVAYYRDRGELELYSAEPEPVLAQAHLEGEELYSSNLLLVDRGTGVVLFSQGGDLAAEPASVTKIMTAITALELIEDLDEKVILAREDFTGLYAANASLSGFEVGEEVSYRDLLYTLMLVSGCDSAYTLARALAGSIPEFAVEMNKKAQELDLTNSNFVDPSGLTAPNHYMSGIDTARILDYALKNSDFRDIFTSREYTVAQTNLRNEPRVIKNFYFSRLEKDFAGTELANGCVLQGGKTGFTNKAGLCLATVGEFQGREYIAVIFGGPGTNKTPQYNFMDAITMFGALRDKRS